MKMQYKIKISQKTVCYGSKQLKNDRLEFTDAPCTLGFEDVCFLSQ